MNPHAHHVSPLGDDVQDDVRAKYESDPAYRAEWDRQALAFELARAVYERRTELGLSQEELGTRAGTTGSAVSRIESGRHTASIPALQRLAVALDTHLVVRFEEQSDLAVAS